ncbi:MAG: OmpA family protein [Bacteroidales bacterium]|nr:OmpA family protein [Bacteroidales bacterium]
MKKVLLLTIILNYCLMVSAQDTISLGYSTIKQNWYVDGFYGGQILFSTDANNRTNRVTHFFGIDAGKLFTPFIGVEISLDALKKGGANASYGLYKADEIGGRTMFGNNDPYREFATINPDGSYNVDIKYWSSKLLLFTSIMNIIHKGYNSSCKYDIYPYFGLGYMRVIKQDGLPEANVLTMDFRLKAKYAIYKNFDLFAQCGLSVLPDLFEGRITGSMHHASLDFACGVRYNIGSKHFSTNILKDKEEFASSEPPENIIEHDTVFVEKVVEKIVEDTTDKYANKFILDSLTITTIVFPIGKSTPSVDINIRYQQIVNFMNKYPKCKVILHGYSDKDTGTEKINYSLSQKRAEYVYNQLINKYHVDKNRLEIIANSSKVQHYDKADYNRIVIAVAVLDE